MVNARPPPTRMVSMARTSELEGDEGGAELSATPRNSLGTIVAGTYRITRHIGSGGSSHVFEAEHVRLGKPFAIKLLRPELDPTRQTAQRFRREARAIAKLSSEYIVSVVDCGELPDQTPYLVMDLLEGEDLRSLLKRERSLPARRVVPLMVEACRALTEAHGAGLVHRDLKPENLFITRRSTGVDWCKVLDFGVAKMDASLATTQGAIVGTVRYMAPEQLADGAKVGPATDIYALGAILYECLSGHPAHVGDSIQEAMFSVLNKEPPPLESVPQALGSLVQRCLAKDPTQRPGSAQALEKLLSAAVNPGAAAAPDRTVTEDDAPSPAVPAANRPANRLPSLVGAVLAGALLSGAVLTWFGAQSADPPSAVAAPLPVPSGQLTNTVHPPRNDTPVGAPGQSEAAPAVPSAVVASASASAVSDRPRPAAVHAAHVTSLATQPAAPSAPAAPAVGKLDPANPYQE